jgi:hypothetical protein
MTTEEVVQYIVDWQFYKKTGSIQINMFKGGISNITLTQSVKTQKEGERKNGTESTSKQPKTCY